jgi:two-component system, NarL family, invasion response regulator UvrY
MGKRHPSPDRNTPEMTLPATLALFVADQSPLIHGLRAILASMPGVSVLEAGDVTSALQLIDDRRPTLIVLDCDMPGAGACGLVARIKSDFPEVRCVALVDTVEEQRPTLGAGAEIALLKGFPAKKLFDIIDGLLSGNGNAQGPEDICS